MERNGWLSTTRGTRILRSKRQKTTTLFISTNVKHPILLSSKFIIDFLIFVFSAWHYVLEEDNRLFFSKEKAGKSKDDMVNITWQKII